LRKQEMNAAFQSFRSLTPVGVHPQNLLLSWSSVFVLQTALTRNPVGVFAGDVRNVCTG
jgi:hypothetical protein